MMSLRPPLIAGAMVLLVASCAQAPSGGRQASAAQQAACRQRADEVYAKQNRADVYRADTYQAETRDAPFSNAGQPGITTRGLSSQYARDTLVSDCLNDAAGNVGSGGGPALSFSPPTFSASRPPANPLATPPTSSP